MGNLVNKYDLSIIIPCHNLEKFINPMLESLQAQEFSPCTVELIFVCDACTDNTKQIITQFLPQLSQYKSIHILSTNYHLAGIARNEGLSIAQGKYIWFIDGDDWLLGSSAIQLCYKVVTEHPDLDVLEFDFDCPEKYSKYLRQGEAVGAVWPYWFKRNALGKARFPSIAAHEDVYFLRHLSKKRLLTAKIKNKLYYYNYMREGSIIWGLVQKGLLNNETLA